MLIDGAAVLAQDDEVGQLAALDRARLVLLAERVGAVDG
jgi:hypothetical protein